VRAIARSGPETRSRAPPRLRNFARALLVGGEAQELPLHRVDLSEIYRDVVGALPGSKISMMIIRPPQQGQGCENICGSPSPVLSASLG
jgi:hypothetical protein